jgi:hypothetical protein
VLDQKVIMNALTNNPRDVILIEIPPSAMSSNRYVDPWKRPYVVAVDETGNGFVEIYCPCPVAGGSAIDFTGKKVRETVAVCSFGPDPVNVQKRVYSWK